MKCEEILISLMVDNGISYKKKTKFPDKIIIQTQYKIFALLKLLHLNWSK